MDKELCAGCNKLKARENLYTEITTWTVSTDRRRVIKKLPRGLRGQHTNGNFCLVCVKERQDKLVRGRAIREKRIARALREMARSKLQRRRAA